MLNNMIIGVMDEIWCDLIDQNSDHLGCGHTWGLAPATLDNIMMFIFPIMFQNKIKQLYSWSKRLEGNYIYICLYSQH